MKSKKILGLLLACALGFSVLPGNAFAKDINRAEPGIQYVAPDLKTVFNKLEEEGLLDKDTTEAELAEILKGYFSSSEHDGKMSLNEKIKREKIMNRMKDFGIKKEKDLNRSMSIGRNNLKLPDQIQEEDYAGKLHVAKPLVILMDFQDYTFEDMKDENIAYKFDDYGTQYFQEMLFNDETFKGPNGEDLITMKQYYLQQSGGSYTVDGNVTGWYRAQHDAKYYGEMVNENTKDRDARSFVREALVAAAGDVKVDLSQYDVEDRYDFDNDGDYNEPDGVIDHIIVIHAGVGQEQGGGNLGDDAMWSHRWVLGAENFEFTDHEGKVWKANDYTLQPQSGAVGVFAHEYGHDLGLPDLYDTTGASYAGSPVGAWSIMSGGSWSGELAGAEPTGFGPWEKEFLQASMQGYNWLKGATIDLNNIPADGYSVLLDEASSKGVNNDVVRINLPDYEEEIVPSVDGELLVHSTKGNNLDTNMTMNVDLTGKTSAVLKFKTNYSIEEGWDWGSVEVAVAGSDNYKVMVGNLPIVQPAPGAPVQVENGISGSSNGWVDAEFDLSEFAGQNIDIRFRYQTDPAYEDMGWYIDKVQVDADGEAVFAENFEGTVNAEFDGFEVNNGKATYGHYYLAEWRSHNKADAGLKFASDSIEYDKGLVLWYVNNDKYQEKNHVAEHPGEGFLSVVDADQQYDPYLLGGEQLIYGPSEIRLHDAAFGLNETRSYEDEFLFTSNSGKRVSYTDTETFMNPYFSDAKDYTNGWNKYLKESGVIVPKYGLRIYVTGQSKDQSVGRIHIMRAQK